MNLGLALRRAAHAPLRVPNCISPAHAHAVALGLTAGRGATVAAARAHDALHELATTLYLSELLVQGARLAHRRDAAACSLQRIYSHCRRRSGGQRKPTLKDGARAGSANGALARDDSGKDGAKQGPRRGLSSGQSDDLWIAELDAVSPVQRVSRHHHPARNGGNNNNQGGGGGGVDKGSVIEDSVLDVMDDSALVPMDEPTLMGVSLRREASTSAAFTEAAAPPPGQQQPPQQRRLQLAPVPEPLLHGYSSIGGSRSNASTPRSGNNVRVDDKTAPAGHGDKGSNRFPAHHNTTPQPHETGTVFEAEKALWLDGLTREFRLADQTGAGTLASEVVFAGLRKSTPGASKDDLLDLINDWRLPDGRVMYMNMIASLKSHTPAKGGGNRPGGGGGGSNGRDFMAVGFDPNAQPDDDDDNNGGAFDEDGDAGNSPSPRLDEEVIAGLYNGLGGSNNGDDDDLDIDGAEHAFRVDDDGQEDEEEEMVLRHGSSSRGMMDNGLKVAPPPPPRIGHASPPLSPRRFDSSPSLNGVGARAGKGAAGMSGSGETGPTGGLARQGNFPRLGLQQRPAGSAPRPTTAYRSVSSPNVTSPTEGSSTSAVIAARAEAAVQAQRQKFAPRRVSSGVGFPGNRGGERGGGSPTPHPDDGTEAAGTGQGGTGSSRPSASASRDRGASLKEAALDRVAAAERQATNRAAHNARAAAAAAASNTNANAAAESEELAALRSQVAQLTAQQKDVAELQHAAANLQAAHNQLQMDHEAALQRQQQQQHDADVVRRRDADARARAEANAASAAEAHANAERRANQAAVRAEEAAAAAATSAASAGFARHPGMHLHASVPPPPPARPGATSSSMAAEKQGEGLPRHHCRSEGGRYTSPLVGMTGGQVAAWAKEVGILRGSSGTNNHDTRSEGLAALAAGDIDGRALAFLADGAAASVPSGSGNDKSSTATTAAAPWEYLKYLRSELGLPAPMALRFAFELNALASSSTSPSNGAVAAAVGAGASEPVRELPLMSDENDDDEVEDGEAEGGGDPPSPTRRAAARDAVIGGADYGSGYGNSHTDDDQNAHPSVGRHRQASQDNTAVASESAAREGPPGAGRGSDGATAAGGAPNRPAPSSPRQPRSRQPNPTPPSAVRALFRGGDVY